MTCARKKEKHTSYQKRSKSDEQRALKTTTIKYPKKETSRIEAFWQSMYKSGHKAGS
jgi:hypothetical protein